MDDASMMKAFRRTAITLISLRSDFLDPLKPSSCFTWGFLWRYWRIKLKSTALKVWSNSSIQVTSKIFDRHFISLSSGSILGQAPNPGIRHSGILKGKTCIAHLNSIERASRLLSASCLVHIMAQRHCTKLGERAWLIPNPNRNLKMD